MWTLDHHPWPNLGPMGAVWWAGHWRAVRPRPRRPCKGFGQEQPSATCLEAQVGVPPPGAKTQRGVWSQAAASAWVQWPQTFLEAKGAQLACTSDPCVSEGPPCLSPRAWPGAGFGPPWAWKVRRPGTAGHPEKEMRSGRLGQSAREDSRTLTASPEAKGNLPRDPSELQNKPAISGAA